MLLLLHSHLCSVVVNLLLKWEVRVCALNSLGNYIVDNGKSWKNHGIVFLNFCGNPAWLQLTFMIWLGLLLRGIYCQTNFHVFFQMRDVKAVGVKFWHVLYPKQSSSLLRECKYTVLPAKSDSYVTFCLQSYQGLTIERSLVY